MRIQIDPHTLERATERGASKHEIKDVLISGSDIPAKSGRRGKAKVYTYNQKRLGTFFEQKRIEVIYTIERDRIVTVTVYVFYGNWEATR
ncbi:MAG: DUF4258 domain-containing protein [Nitrospiraceae bacterium]|nr:MAG: DUF4258 domain-containing protein [Nitrospiraceae bacterium]